MRDRIWYSLIEVKTNEYYTGYVTRFYQIGDWLLNTFLVITTSASVTAWVIWQKAPLLWACIIGFSQICMLLKPFLLFPKYVKSYNEKNINFQNLSCDLENLWYKLENGKITEDVAEKDYDKIRRRILENDKFPDEVIVFQHNGALYKAEAKTDNYLKRL